ncbi:hypothetical protein L210DRAFT_3510342 [Boletus edulis BED1]|uniref:Uncharacterized protein n=1 Tax=Boletus edulis BED1 TaxID=1328754 RepID=A0AAD4BDR3_BOLED|nr:hypothetical protein L210DRAFT_3510342 [Boletus edulis BED1]
MSPQALAGVLALVPHSLPVSLISIAIPPDSPKSTVVHAAVVKIGIPVHLVEDVRHAPVLFVETCLTRRRHADESAEINLFENLRLGNGDPPRDGITLLVKHRCIIRVGFK